MLDSRQDAGAVPAASTINTWDIKMFGTNRLPRKPMNSGEEYDVLTNARKFYCYTQRPKVCKKVKRAYNKKERRWLDRVFMMGAK